MGIGLTNIATLGIILVNQSFLIHLILCSLKYVQTSSDCILADIFGWVAPLNHGLSKVDGLFGGVN